MVIGSAIATISSASPILADGSVPFTFFGVTVNTPGAYVTHTQFTVGSVLVSNDGSGSFGSCPAATCVAVGSTASMTTPFFGDGITGLVLAFGAGNRYTYTVTSQVTPNISKNGASTTDNIFTFGNFHDTTGTFADAAASLVFAFSEACTSANTGPCSESGSATFATPPAAIPTPEPAFLFLTGSALLGLGVVRRRAVA